MSTQQNHVQCATVGPVVPVKGNLIQRKCACGGTSESAGQCEKCKAKRETTLQRRVANQGAAPAASSSAVPPVVHEVLGSPGHSLDAGTRAYMEPRFGHDFSNVRVHTDARAAESARAVNALAYTVGRGVVFGTGQYMPGTSAGQKLLAHELTHVVQQQGASSSNVQKTLAIGEPNDAYEREAEAHAVSVIENDAIQATGRPDIARLQRQADTAKADPEKVDPAKVLSDAHQGCTVATTAGPAAPSYATLSFRLGSFDLSSKEEGEIKIDSNDEDKITDFVTDMRSRRSSENIRIDGYASTDGDEARNWILSCGRATAARRELTTKHGIPEAKIKTFAHGPTSEFGSGETESDRAKNRIATLSTVPAPSPTLPPGPQPDPASTPSTNFSERVKNVHLTIGRRPGFLLARDAPLVTVTLDDFLRAKGTAEVTGGPDCNKFIFGFFQICRPFDVERTIYHSLTTSTDLDVDRSDALRASEPALDVLQPGGIWTASQVSPKCAAKNSPARVSVDFSDKPGTAFVMHPSPVPVNSSDDFITGLAWQDSFFTTFSVQHPDGTIQHLKSFYWDIHFCRKIDPPSPGHPLGTVVNTVANVTPGGVMDGAPSEPGLSLTGKRAGRTCNQIAKETPRPAPRSGTFDIGCS